MSSYEERVKEVIDEQLGASADEVTNEASLSDDLGMDPKDADELVMALDEAFGMDTFDEDAQK